MRILSFFEKQFPVSLAILVGSILISISILISGGVIRLKDRAGVGGDSPTPQATEQAAPQKVVTLDDVKNAFSKSQIKFGDTDKKLIVLEIADPSCPFCHVAAGKNPTINKQIDQQRGSNTFTLVSDGGSYIAPVPEIEKLVRSGKAAFAYIYYPGHGAGEMGTKAFYCAQEKGKFWEVHNLLMSSAGYDLINNQVKNDKSKSSQLVTFLQSAIDPGFMKQCLESGKYDSQLQTDISLASNLNIAGTPGFYLNATPFSGAYSFSDMEGTVKTALGE